MSPAPGRFLNRSDTLPLLICLSLSVAALLLPTAWAQAFAGGVRNTALLPLIWLQQRAEEGRTSRARLQAMQAERDTLALRAQAVPGLAAENARLRALLDLKARTGLATVAAEVLHQSTATDGRTLLLGVGRNQGVRPSDPVVAPEGLLGLVVNAGPTSSIAMTWAHPDLRVSAVTEDGGVLGIVAPSSGDEASEAFLELRGVPYRDTLALGTVVMTSGLTGVYPRGIPIGRVAGIRREELGWERVYRLTPLANPGHVAHVLVYVLPEGRRARATVRPESPP